MRVTAARRLVIAALFAADRPIGADEVAGGLDGRLPRSDVGSVYRNLERLEAIGLVRHVHLGHGPGLYTLAGRERGAHVVCERCGRHQELTSEDLAPISAMIRERIAYVAQFDHFPIVGRCADCAEGAS